MADDDLAKTSEYDFNTTGTEVWHIQRPLFTLRESTRLWNETIQSWLVNYTYKRIPNKSFRGPATFLLSAFWHSTHTGYYILAVSYFFYLYVENIIERITKRRKLTGMVRHVVDMTFLIFYQLNSSIFITIHLLSMERCYRYYGSVYFLNYWIMVIALIIGLFIKQIQKLKKIEVKMD